jgi:hypothetical protein
LQEEANMTGDPLLVLDALVQVFPQVSAAPPPHWIIGPTVDEFSVIIRLRVD